MSLDESQTPARRGSRTQVWQLEGANVSSAGKTLYFDKKEPDSSATTIAIRNSAMVMEA